MRLNFVKCIKCEINKAKDYTFTLLAKAAPKAGVGYKYFTLT